MQHNTFTALQYISEGTTALFTPQYLSDYFNSDLFYFQMHNLLCV